MESSQRRLLSRLQDGYAASSDRRSPLPRQHQNRVVPWNNLTDDSDRLFARERQEVSIGRDGVAVNLISVAGVVTKIRSKLIKTLIKGKSIKIKNSPQCVDRALNVEDSIFEWFSVIQGLQVGERRGVAFDQIGQPGM